MNTINLKHRRKARSLVLQAIYQWQLADTNLDTIEQQFFNSNKHLAVDWDYFKDLLRGVITNIAELDQTLVPILDRSLKELTPVELAILRLAHYELAHRWDVPYRVVINEALELTKIYGAQEGYKYVNGVLDKLAHQLRPLEFEKSEKP